MKGSIKNIAANYGSRVWGFASVYLFTPLYIRLLGIESYAVIGFYTLILGIISFADAGISSAINREFAKAGSHEYKLAILKLFERIYGLICLLVGCSIFLGARYLASRWLRAEGISEDGLTLNIRLIGIGIALQLMTSIYFGGLMGLQKQVRANALQTFWSIFRAGGVVIVLYLLSNSLATFFVWTIGCNLIYLIFLRISLLQCMQLNGTVAPLLLHQVDNGIWKFLGGMVLVAVMSAINMQVDKIVTSKVFSLVDFGYYSLASLLAQVPFIIATPIVIAVFPQMTLKFSEGRMEEFYIIAKRYSFIISCIVFPVCCLLVIYGEDIFLMWIRNKDISPQKMRAIQLAVRWLVSSNTALALQLIPFYLLMARGKTIYSVIQTFIQMLFVIPALYFFVSRYGFAGVGIPSFIINTAGLIYLLVITSRLFFGAKTLDYFKATLMVPLLINLLSACAIYGIYIALPADLYSLIIAVIIETFTVLANIYVYNRLNRGSELSIKGIL